jgi:hypothetical protein
MRVNCRYSKKLLKKNFFWDTNTLADRDSKFSFILARIYEHKTINDSACVIITNCLRPESDGRGWLRGTARQPSLPPRQLPVTTPTMASLPEAAAAAAALDPAAVAEAAGAADTTTAEPAAAAPAGSPPDPLMPVRRPRYAIPVNL